MVINLLMGAALGFLSGLGIGGGSLLIMYLQLALAVPQETARSINLMFFVPSALIACLFRWRQGSLHLKKVLPGILAGCSSAFACSYLAMTVDGDALRRPFGILLLLTGIRELCYRPRKER